MASARAERRAVGAGGESQLSLLWADLNRRQIAELALPGAMIGLLGGAIAGGMAALGGLSLPVSLVAMVGLAVPLGACGAAYDLLVASGRIPLGPLTPAALFWLGAFPVARVMHAAIINLAAGEPVAVPHGWLDFVVYQMLLSVGFAIGFWWLHQSFAPRWWYRLRDQNPVANHIIREQLRFVGILQEQREQRRLARKGKQATSGRSRRRAR